MRTHFQEGQAHAHTCVAGHHRPPAGETLLPTPHELLDLPPDATATQVRAAYRRAALTTHPDLGGDPAAFRAVHAAYRQLLDPDTARPAGSGGPPGEPAPGNPAPGRPDDGDRVEPVRVWKAAFDTAVVRWPAYLTLAVLRLAGSGTVVAAVAGLWAAVTLAVPVALLWTMSAVRVVWRRRGQPYPRHARPRPWRRRLLHVVAVVAGLPMAVVAVSISGATFWLAGRGLAQLTRWLAG